MSKTYSKTRTLVECALMIALGTVLANIKIFEMPTGSITLLSMLPFILVSYRHGTKWGLFTGFVNSLLQMLLGFYAPPAPGLLPLVGMILLDYVLAFTLLGLAGAIAKPFKQLTRCYIGVGIRLELQRKPVLPILLHNDTSVTARHA